MMPPRWALVVFLILFRTALLPAQEDCSQAEPDGESVESNESLTPQPQELAERPPELASHADNVGAQLQEPQEEINAIFPRAPLMTLHELWDQ